MYPLMMGIFIMIIFSAKNESEPFKAKWENALTLRIMGTSNLFAHDIFTRRRQPRWPRELSVLQLKERNPKKKEKR